MSLFVRRAFFERKEKILDKTKQEMGGELQNGDSSRLTGPFCAKRNMILNETKQEMGSSFRRGTLFVRRGLFERKENNIGRD